ncbi:MAG: sulfite exporter TauE/SafE family protein [Rhodospirillales bacterium]|nr:sulfite exporter TauE/SafE family protein [Rhodospirillales bacterium]
MVLAFLFFMTALLYACVGFGGGSTYNALLVLNETEYRIIPFIALTCNIIVVSGGVWHFSRHKHIKIEQILPWIILSVPAAWLGGYIKVPEVVFIGVLGSALLLSGIKMLWPENEVISLPSQNRRALAGLPLIPPVVGASLGFLAGMTGIGGGIFLAPVLHLLRWSDPKNIAGTCSLFILVNSLAGLVGQMMKLDTSGLLQSAVSSYWIVLPAVFIGGQIGSWMGASRINIHVIRKITAILILYVSIRLLWRFFITIGFI